MSDTKVHRVIGLDLGVTSLHSAVVLDEAGRVRAWRRVSSTVDSLGKLEQIALGDTAEATTLTVVIEPTGPMWLPVACTSGDAATPCSGAAELVFERLLADPIDVAAGEAPS